MSLTAPNPRISSSRCGYFSSHSFADIIPQTKEVSMLTVTLKPDLAEQITHLAGSKNSIDAFIDQALRTYLTRVPSLTRLPRAPAGMNLSRGKNPG